MTHPLLEPEQAASAGKGPSRWWSLRSRFAQSSRSPIAFI